MPWPTYSDEHGEGSPCCQSHNHSKSDQAELNSTLDRAVWKTQEGGNWELLSRDILSGLAQCGPVQW